MSRPQREKAIAIDLIIDDEGWEALEGVEALLEHAAAEVSRHVRKAAQGASVSIALSSDAEVARLNAAYRNKPKATNVLSFPAGRGAPKGFLGDVILAAGTVAREAREQDTPLGHHVQHLIVHGLLHLLGYDHEAADDAERMEALEIAILDDLGIANPYTGELETAKKE